MLTVDTPLTPEDDCYHPLSDNPYETETNWWAFNIPERKIGGWLHCEYYPNRKSATWRVYVWDDSGATPSTMAYYRKARDVPMPDQPDLRDITFPNGGYSLKMLEPLRKYHLSYTDPERDFALEFTFTGVHEPRRFPPGNAPFVTTPHLDQLGHYEGWLMLRGERIPIDCYSVRDRTWGPRGAPYSGSPKVYESDLARVRHPGGPRWREIERERGRGRIQYIFGHAGPDLGFLSFVRMQDGDASGWSPMQSGWVLKDGVFSPIDSRRSRMIGFRDPRIGWTRFMQVSATDEQGRTLEAEGIMVSHMTEDGYGANSLFRWEMEGRIGWGEDQDYWRPSHFSRMLHALKSVRQGEQ